MSSLNKHCKCLECHKCVSPKTGFNCSECRLPIHPRCTKLKANAYKKFKDPLNKYLCRYCENFKCGKCDKPIYNDDNSLQCECITCKKWYHLRCTKVSLKQYNEFNKMNASGSSSPPWFCASCLCEPFSGLNNGDLAKILFDNRLENNTRKLIKKTNFKNICPCCNRKIASDKIAKALPCRTCFCLTHRKCSRLSNYELNNCHPSDLIHWECYRCHQEKFPCIDLPDEDLHSLTYNSNFDCTCKTKCDTDSFKIKWILSLAKYRNEDPKRTDGPDPECNIDQTFDLNVQFDYYDTHKYHKLAKHFLRGKEPFSIYHTNIQSLNCNFDSLHRGLANLDFPFDIIALSETWNPKYKDNFTPGRLPGYKKFNGIQGTTLKSGCGFYIRDTLKTIDRPDLDESHYDDNNEFQGKWSEIVNTKGVNILMAVFYRHPKKCSNEVFNQHLTEKLNKIKLENKQI